MSFAAGRVADGQRGHVCRLGNGNRDRPSGQDRDQRFSKDSDAEKVSDGTGMALAQYRQPADGELITVDERVQLGHEFRDGLVSGERWQPPALRRRDRHGLILASADA